MAGNKKKSVMSSQIGTAAWVIKRRKYASFSAGQRVRETKREAAPKVWGLETRG